MSEEWVKQSHNIESMTIQELKVLVYDISVYLAQCQNDLQIVNKEINKRNGGMKNG